MDILNPPKEEQSLDTDGGDAVQYQQRKNYKKDIREDIYFPKDSREASAFIRSYANKINGMKENSKKNVVVFTENNAYFAVAKGYLKGDIEKVVQIDGNEQKIADVWKEFNNGSNRSRKAINSWRQNYRSRQGRNNSNTVGTGKNGATRKIAQLDGRVYGGSNSFRAYWEDYGYNSWEEMIDDIERGVILYDENGEILAIEQYQQRTYALTDWEVLEHAYDALDKTDMEPGELTALDIFKGRLDTLRDLQRKRTEQGRLYREQQFGTKVDRAAAEQTRNRIDEF